MGWQERLRPADYDGVPFGVKESDFEFGRNTIEHEFPGRDIGFTEDVNRLTRKYTLRAFIVGDDYMEIRDALIDALEKPGPGILTHPYYGRIKVNSGLGRAREVFDKGAFVEVSFTFKLAGENVTPNVTDDTKFNFLSAATVSRAESEGYLAKNFDLSIASNFVRDVLENDVLNSIDAFTDAAAALSSEAISIINSIKGRVSSLILTPDILAAEISRLMITINTFSVETLLSVADNEFDKPINTGSVDAAAQSSSQLALEIFNSSQAVIRAAETLVESDFLSIDDENAQFILSSEQVFDQMTDILDSLDVLLDKADLQNDDTGTLDLIDSFNEFRSTLSNDIAERSAGLSTLETVEIGRTMPTIVAAYEIHGDHSRDTELIRENGIENPNIIQQGTSLQVRK